MVSTRKKFILNLNNYRNAHFRVLSKAKNSYNILVARIAPKIDYKIVRCKLTYEYYHGSARKVDVSNPCTVIDKFSCDGLTHIGYWDDDDSKTIHEVKYVFKGIDRDNPRCDLIIEIEKSKPLHGKKSRKN